jgi:hypothetical protein
MRESIIEIIDRSEIFQKHQAYICRAIFVNSIIWRFLETLISIA